MPARDEATTATSHQGATAATPPQIKTQSDPATGGVKLGAGGRYNIEYLDKCLSVCIQKIICSFIQMVLVLVLGIVYYFWLRKQPYKS